MSDDDFKVPDDISEIDRGSLKFQVHELAYDEIDTFNNEFRLACYHLEKFADSIRGSISNEVADGYESSMIHLDFGVAEALVQLEHGKHHRWRIQVEMHRPDVAGQE